MAKALGVGGIFFKAQDPAALAGWYARVLEIDIDASFGGTTFAPGAMPAGAITVWAPFSASTDYFAPSANAFMFNLVVDDLREALKQVVAGGGTVVGDVVEEPYGDFGWFVDPEGNKVELWQPATPPAD
jgi:predicted enzyme related to lactoylglutathione lyase